MRSKREKVTEARALMEKAAVLLDEVGYDHEAEWVRDVANGLDVVVSNDPELEKTTGA